MNLSKEQTTVINHTTQPALVLAGPGSGKTTVITQRLLRLISDYADVKIICLTFSKAATLEMESRFHSILPNASDYVHFSTLHSLAYAIMKRGTPAGKMPMLLDSKDCPYNKYAILQKIYREINNRSISVTETEKLIGWISRSRNDSLDTAKTDVHVQIKNFEAIKLQFERYKRENNLIDFDDMMLYALNILQNDKAQQTYWSGLYDFVQVDEGQDLTPSQFKMIEFIAPHNNIFIVADDDQSIYGFRGTSPKNIIHFEKDLQCTRYVLNNNFRCASEIVSFSSNMIKKNSMRFPKNYISQNKNPGKVRLLHTKNTYCQAEFIQNDILTGTQKNFGILYRNNDSSMVPAALLIKNHISFQISGGTLEPYTEYINLFLMECIKAGVPGCKMPNVYQTVVTRGFATLCKSRKKSYDQEADTVETVIDLLYAVFELCQNLTEVRDLLIKLDKTYQSGQYEGDILPEKEIFLSTIHSAKGLEYDTVYLINVNKDKFPGKSSVSGTLLEEERRLFYVGATRARQFLSVMFVENYGLKPTEESLFYKEAITARKGM